MAREYRSIPSDGGVLPTSAVPGSVPGVMYVLRNTLAYTDTVAKTLFTIPDGAIIVDWICNVTTVFDDTGTDLVNVGVTGTAGKFVTNMAGGVAGLITSGIVASQIGVVQSGAQTVKGIYAGQNSNAANGAMTVMCRYFIP